MPYAIIYWTDDDTLRPFTSGDGTLWLADTLAEANIRAMDLKELLGYDCRVISIEAVQE